MNSPIVSTAFRPILWCALFAAICLGAGCAGVATQAPAATTGEATAQPEPEPEIIRVEPERPKLELTEDLLYKLLLGEIAGQRGQIGISLENYMELARTTRDPKVVERATQIAIYARNETAANESATLWAELDPHNPDAHQVLAAMALRRGDIEATLDHLREILEYSEGDPNRNLWLIASLLGREEDKPQVMTVMERLLEERKDNPQAVFAFANIAARMGETDRALELLELSLKLEPGNDAVALGYITLLQRLERAEEALDWLEKRLADKKADDFNIRLAYARLLTDVQRFDEARRQFEMLAVNSPENSDVIYALGLLYLQANRLDDAETQFKRLVEQNERFYNAKYYLGRIAEEREDFDAASTWYRSVAGDENFFDAQVRLVLLQARDGELEEALKNLRAIQAPSPQQKALLIQAEGDLLNSEKRHAEALAVYDKALADGEYNPDLLYARAMTAEKLGRIDLLEKDLREIISRDPKNVQALNALGYTLADRTERYAEAFELIEQALALSPNDFFIVDSMGWVMYRMGRHEEALEYLQKALKQREDPEIAAHLYEVLWVMGKQDEANKVWETAKQSNPDSDLLNHVKERLNP
jgi:tetratricopeptide (TPR) repeat protein